MARPKLLNAKRKKIDMRVSDTQKKTLEQAASLRGKPTATWIIETCLREAAHMEAAHMEKAP